MFMRDCLTTSREEGGDDVKSAWPLRPGLHTSYNGEYNGLQPSNSELILQNSSQFELRAEIRPHEVGIGSNRGSSDRGEYVLRSCTHCPSSQQSWQRPKRYAQRSSKARLAMKTKS